MASEIVATKLYIPPFRASLVLRPRLTERLSESLASKLTLVSAPAGFGKTTLVGEWAARCQRPVAWLSLDEGDSDLTRFLKHFVAAIRSIVPDFGQGVLSALTSAQLPPAESLSAILLNEMTAVPQPMVLVLDDYHLADENPVDVAVKHVIEHLPPHTHIVIITREDPLLHLARLRARGQLTELRASDLRFTASEAAEFLNRTMGLSLSQQDVTLLETRTEGWIAGLQLAALSMQGRSDIDAFLRAFTGSHRFVLDYLVEEVLERQPEDVRDFMLQTSVLERLCGPLCDAATAGEGGAEVLRDLERANLFVVPLDDERKWYRYHHLFADALHARLQAEQPNKAALLHQRASVWFELNDLRPEAIRHALVAEDFSRAADLIELEARGMLARRQEEMLLGWLAALPDELVRSRPVLSAYSALALVATDLSAAESRLQDAERLLTDAGHTRYQPVRSLAHHVAFYKNELRSLPGIVAITRAYHSGALGDTADSVSHARRALALLPTNDHLWRGAANALVGLASWTVGELEGAYRSFSDGMSSLRKAGDITQSNSGAFILADIRMAQGRLRDAEKIYARALQIAAGENGRMLLGSADLFVGMSELRLEYRDLEGAELYLRKSKDLGAHDGLPENRHRWYVAMARIKEASNDFDGALDLLDEAERVYIPSPDPYVRPITALRTRVWIKQGRLTEAKDWAKEAKVAYDDPLDFLREFEHITLARVFIAHFKSDSGSSVMHQAQTLLERLLQAAEAGGRIASVIEIMVLQALAHQVSDDVPSALVPLERALVLAEPEGFVNTLVNEGAPMYELLKGAAGNTAYPHVKRYCRRLLAVLEKQNHSPSSGAGQNASFPLVRNNSNAERLLEPLSERELEVLRLVAQGLSNHEISKRLFRALSTIKGHNRVIFEKLQVKSRTEAVARAREAGLL